MGGIFPIKMLEELLKNETIGSVTRDLAKEILWRRDHPIMESIDWWHLNQAIEHYAADPKSANQRIQDGIQTDGSFRGAPYDNTIHQIRCRAQQGPL